MKLLPIAVMVGLCTSVYAQGTIVGSAHDFSTQGWSMGQICLPCHAPHDNNRDPALFGTSLLWNHSRTTATYTMYTSFAMAAKGIIIDPQPAGPSITCLSCHDGTVALDSFGGLTGSSFIPNAYRVPGSKYWDNPTPGQGTVGSLQNTHPISVTYDETKSDLHPKTNPFSPGEPTIGDALIQGKVECGTCHDVHNTDTVGFGLLRVTTAQSAICLRCHDK